MSTLHDARLRFASLALVLASCGGEPEDNQPAPAPSPSPAPAIAREIRTPEVHRAICGHVLDEVGHCGNYVSLDGRYVEIRWPKLGIMEWCKQGQNGAEIEITGAMQDGKFVATSLQPVK